MEAASNSSARYEKESVAAAIRPCRIAARARRVKKQLWRSHEQQRALIDGTTVGRVTAETASNSRRARRRKRGSGDEAVPDAR